MALKKREFTPESGSVDTYANYISQCRHLATGRHNTSSFRGVSSHAKQMINYVTTKICGQNDVGPYLHFNEEVADVR